MTNEPKFKVGDRVAYKNTEWKINAIGKVEVKGKFTEYAYHLLNDNDFVSCKESELSHAEG